MSEIFRPGERSILVDPSGNPPVRSPGIDVLLYPQTSPEQRSESLVLASVSTFGNQIFGSTQERLSFSCVARLPIGEYRKLKSVESFLLANGGNLEVVVYYLWERFTEVAAIRSRANVPDTSIISTNYGDVNQFSYYPVLQGMYEVQSPTLVGSTANSWYEFTFNFIEGTIVQPL